MREVDEIGATCMYLAPCESVPCTDITAEQLQALVSTVTCIATCVRAPRRCTASTGEGRSMLWPPSRARIESYEKTFAEGGVLLSFLRTYLSKSLCVRRRPEARRPLPKSDDSGPPGRATPRPCTAAELLEELQRPPDADSDADSDAGPDATESIDEFYDGVMYEIYRDRAGADSDADSDGDDHA